MGKGWKSGTQQAEREERRHRLACDSLQLTCCPRSLQLGLLTKSLCQVLLGFVRQLNKYLHYSFGDGNGEERPHIVFPFWSNVDRMVVTKEGEKPPELGLPLQEDPQHRAQRIKSFLPCDWDTSCTYTASFNSMYIDLPKWKLCNLPMMRASPPTCLFPVSSQPPPFLPADPPHPILCVPCTSSPGTCAV